MVFYLSLTALVLFLPIGLHLPYFRVCLGPVATSVYDARNCQTLAAAV